MRDLCQSKKIQITSVAKCYALCICVPRHVTAKCLRNGITSTIVNYNGGQYVIEGGYLDVGIIDTMKDLMVNCIGAVVFSIIGILYIKHRGKGKIAKSFIPLMKTTEEIEETQKMIEEFKSKKRRNKNEKVKLNIGVNNDGDNGIGSDSTGE